LIVTKNRNYAGYRPRIASGSSATPKAAAHSGNVSPEELANLFASQGFENVRVRPALLGRTRLTFAWVVVRWLRRFADPSWRQMPAVIADASESVMLTASSPRT
jgi:hypothetical protein